MSVNFGYQLGYQHLKDLIVYLGLHILSKITTWHNYLFVEIPNSFRQHRRQLSRKHVSSLELFKAQMPHALNSKTPRTIGIEDGSAKTMACKAGGLLGFRALSRTFSGSFADFRVKTLRLSRCFRKTCTLSPLSMPVHCEAFPKVHRQSLSRGQGIPAVSRGPHKKLRANRLGDIRNLPAIRLQEGKGFDRT